MAHIQSNNSLFLKTWEKVVVSKLFRKRRGFNRPNY